jgi:hypothetical protein
VRHDLSSGDFQSQAIYRLEPVAVYVHFFLFNNSFTAAGGSNRSLGIAAL